MGRESMQLALLPASDGGIAPSIVPAAYPFVKWPGGKSQLLGDILSVTPSTFERYLEPFVGGGAVALALAHNPSLLNDANAELMDTYLAVRDDMESLLVLLDAHREADSEEYYYAVRGQDPSVLSPVERAARFIYLNKTGFNGLYRVNRHGAFNVPYGKSPGKALYNRPAMEAASRVLQVAELFTGDYREFLREHARAGDFVYLDPPYVPVGVYSDFKRYTKEQFREPDHRALARLYDDLVGLGAYPVLSNSYSELALELYGHHEIRVVHATRAINKDGAGRGAIPEILVTPGQHE